MVAPLLRKIIESLKQLARQTPLTTAVAAIKREHGLQVDAQTIRNRLHEAKIFHHIPAKKPLMTEKHKEERLGFALQYYSVADDFWKKVIFCDEKTFSTDEHSSLLHCWRPVNTRYEAENIQPIRRSGRITAALWGWMADSGPGELIKVNERLNSHQYTEILEEVLTPSVRSLIPDQETVYVVMDNSPVHNAKAVKEWFTAHQDIIRIEWPAKSADLNPIENLWAYIVSINKWDSSEIRTKGALISHAKSVWESLKPKRHEVNICEKLVDSMPRRLGEVIVKRGSHTKY